MKYANMVSWILRFAAAAIMLQTLYFKFTAHPESVYIFSTIGIEPWGRIGTGISELIASLLILLPTTIIIGAFMGLGIMAGAILTHITVIGLVVQNDHGKLFALSLVVFLCCCLLLVLHKEQFYKLKMRFAKPRR